MLKIGRWMNMHKYIFWRRSKFTLQEGWKSEEKIFRWGDYRADLGLQRGCGGLNSKNITLHVGLYYINYRETPIFTLFNIVGLYYKLKRRNPLNINHLQCILIHSFCINIRRETQKIITYDLTQ